ncbi:sensor histidine kinase [Cellulomonas sp. NPDC057328]|uniref:sensor histidine kinase n=1 Tax=Cellulomonas sp. NPDC057328 TaxID=3346101 RepID=UPI0036314606
MTSTGAAVARRRGTALTTVLRAWWSARGRGGTAHALVGLPLGLVSFALAWVLPVAAVYCAVWSLMYASPEYRVRTVALVALAVVVPLPVLAAIRVLTALQRRRFRGLLGVDLPPPSPDGRWSWSLLREWGAPGTWRQIAYHGLALPLGALGAGAVAASWLAWVAVAAALASGGARPPALAAGWTALAVAALLAAPWVARGVARVDTAAARALLGPSRSETLSGRVESLSRSRADVVAATDAERRRIERDLHDGAQQRLVSLAMNLGMARAALTDASGPAGRAIEAAHDEAVQAVAELRELVRGLHPAVLDDRGLDAALSGIAARAPLPVRLTVAVAPRCSPVIEAIAYFTVSEALTNIAKHAQADHAEVVVERVADRLRVVVSDDGRGGADPDVASDRTGERTGLRGLAQRAASVDGTFHLDSPPGGPTTITVELPCES